MDVGEPFLARTLATRCPQEGNPIVQVASLFNQLLQHFPRTEFAALVKKHAAERDAKGLPAGRSSFPCCFVNSDALTPCARSATAWPAVWGDWSIWGLG